MSGRDIELLLSTFVPWSLALALLIPAAVRGRANRVAVPLAGTLLMIATVFPHGGILFSAVLFPLWLKGRKDRRKLNDGEEGAILLMCMWIFIGLVMLADSVLT